MKKQILGVVAVLAASVVAGVVAMPTARSLSAHGGDGIYDVIIYGPGCSGGQQ